MVLKFGAALNPNSWRLFVTGWLMLNALMGLWAWWDIDQSRRNFEHNAEVTTQNLVNLVAVSLTESTRAIDLTLRALSNDIGRVIQQGRADDQQIESLLHVYNTWIREAIAIRVTDRDGTVRWGTDYDPARHVNWSDRDFFVALRDHPHLGLHIGKVIEGRITKGWLVPFSRAYFAADGSFAGVVVVSVHVLQFEKLLSETRVGPHGVALLRDTDTGLIAHYPHSQEAAARVGAKGYSKQLAEIIASGQEAATFHPKITADGMERINSYRRLATPPFHLVVGLGSEDYLEDWRVDRDKTLVAWFAFMLATSITTILLWKKSRQVIRLGQHSRLLLQNASDGIHILDTDSNVIEASDSFCAMLGYSREEVIGMNVRQWDARFTDQILSQFIAGLHRNKTRAQFETLHRRRDGTTFEVEVSSLPLELDGQSVLFNSSRDITERKAVETELLQYRQHLEELVQLRTQALQETEARASHVLQSSADGLYGIDADCCITFINPAACALLGYTSEQVIGQRAHGLFHHSKPDGSPYPVEECPTHNALLFGQVSRNDKEVYWHADGHPVPVMYAVHPVILNGQVSGAVISFVDMSEQRAAAQAQESALVAAQNLARVRSEFLANMSHEIRTPINGVLGFAEIGYRNYQNSEKARDAFDKIRVSGKRLLGVINDILDFSKIEAGKFNIERTHTVLGEVIGHAVELVRGQAHAKHLGLHVDLAPDLPKTCLGDPLHLGQVLLNLLSNAVKFTESGSVRLGVSRQAEQMVFTVTDTGIGMSEEHLLRLFHPFEQADGSMSRRFGGTGLGLAISKRILELMGGDIRVQSLPGAGSTFEFRLPYLPSNDPLPGQGPATGEGVRLADLPLAGLSILVAEDEPINRMIMEANLVEDGARVVVVDDGLAAVEQVRKEGGGAYDIVLMDIQMPGMDGYEATRALLDLVPDMKIIGQTAHAFVEEKEKCFAAGMVDHIAKPIEPNVLVAMILLHVQSKH